MEGLDFGPEELNRMQMPKGHEGMNPKDIDKCPFAQMGNKGPTPSSASGSGKPSSKLPEKSANSTADEEKDEESEEEVPQGGCPVMTNGRLLAHLQTRTRTRTWRLSNQTSACRTSLQ